MNPFNFSIKALEEKARILRRHALSMTTEAGSGHPGGSLSAADIVTTLFFSLLSYDLKNPHWPDRDRFILSKGHGVPILYAAYAEAGLIPKEILATLRKLGSPLQGHPDKRKLPILEASTGSLGQGLSIGLGMTLARRLDKKDYWVYVLLGDGEIEEGQVWEAAMAAHHHKIDHITAIIDHNGFQLDGPIKEIMNFEPLKEKWEAFGWFVQVIDGHNFQEILTTLEKAKKKQPAVIIAKTIKGKGVSFMEHNNDFHGRALTREELERALKEL